MYIYFFWNLPKRCVYIYAMIYSELLGHSRNCICFVQYTIIGCIWNSLHSTLLHLRTSFRIFIIQIFLIPSTTPGYIHPISAHTRILLLRCYIHDVPREMYLQAPKVLLIKNRFSINVVILWDINIKNKYPQNKIV